MPSITFPIKKNVEYFAINDVYIKADTDSITQYCVENGYTLASFEPENQRFSNDGTVVYVRYDTAKSEWITMSGYDRVVSVLNYT